MRELIDMLTVVFHPKLSEDFGPSSRNASWNSSHPQAAPTVEREALAPATTSGGRNSSARLNPLASPYAAPGVPTVATDAASEAKSRGDVVGVHGRLMDARANNARESSVVVASASASGFWKCFPLFKVYAPDPATVVPCEVVVPKEQTAASREEAESRLRVG